MSPSLHSKRDIELLLKLIANLNMLLRDENVNVVKKAILTMTQLYKVALQVRARPRPQGILPPGLSHPQASVLRADCRWVSGSGERAGPALSSE